jgi:hypothetical protein
MMGVTGKSNGVNSGLIVERDKGDGVEMEQFKCNKTGEDVTFLCGETLKCG